MNRRGAAARFVLTMAACAVAAYLGRRLGNGAATGGAGGQGQGPGGGGAAAWPPRSSRSSIPTRTAP